MRRISLWVLSTLSALVLLFSYSTSTSGVTLASGSLQTPVVSLPSASGTSSAPSTSSQATSGATSSGGTDPSTASSVTGAVASTRWGPVQVKLSVSGGKITQVSVVQYPSGNSRDQEINSYALPVLIKETMAAQSAKVDMVSGATVTSGGYLQSLQSAIDQAQL